MNIRLYVHPSHSGCQMHWLYLHLVQALFLVLRLWSRSSPDFIATCPLIPPKAAPPSKTFFTNSKPDAGNHPVDAADALFSPSHLQRLLSPLRLSSASHPRLHLIWPTLLALLIPGFTSSKVAVDFLFHLTSAWHLHWSLADSNHPARRVKVTAQTKDWHSSNYCKHLIVRWCWDWAMWWALYLCSTWLGELWRSWSWEA